MSISKAQAKALADGFIDSLGEGGFVKGGQFSLLDTILLEYGKAFNESVIENLSKEEQEKVFANLVSRKSGGGVLDTRECAGPVEVATYQAGANPTACHWSCTSSKTGELINLGPAPCPAATF